MEEFGDYIYIVVIAIATLASIFKKRKKSSEDQKTDVPQFPDLSDVISEDKGDIYNPVFVEPEKSFQEILAEKFKAVQTTFQKRSASASMTIQEPDLYEKGQIGDLPTEEEEENWIGSLCLEDVNEAKKAFIYSEIMTRKY